MKAAALLLGALAAAHALPRALHTIEDAGHAHASRKLERGPTTALLEDAKGAIAQPEPSKEDRSLERQAVDLVVANDPSKLVKLPDSWKANPFHEYVIQCSHNTYVGGEQGGVGGALVNSAVAEVATTSVKTMKASLDLGYRCIELDVHPARQRDIDNGEAGSSRLVVAHCGPTGCMTNAIGLSKFVAAIAKWLKEDEDKDVARLLAWKASPENASDEPTVLRTPLVISVENHAHKCKESLMPGGGEACEALMAAMFEEQFAGRLVAPADFAGPHGASLGSLMSDKRKVIIKTGAKKSAALKAITAMPKHGTTTVSHQYFSKSIDMVLGSGEAAKSGAKAGAVFGPIGIAIATPLAAWSQNFKRRCQKFAKALSATKDKDTGDTFFAGEQLLRVYPPNGATKSANYDGLLVLRKTAKRLVEAGIAYDKKHKNLFGKKTTNKEQEWARIPPQMVCLNYQDKCPTGFSRAPMCLEAFRGVKDHPNCACSREQSAPYEQLFMDYGMDSYIHWPSHAAAINPLLQESGH